ncbi:MAG: hypothetical protein FJ313_03670, partial [Gemmatimonadetes bacterium]|nr:hypothetical protein [Gemmatimonadota bacterium]
MRGAMLAVLLLVAGVAPAAPTILWVSDPVRPDETVVLLTEGASAASTVEALRLVDGPTAKPGAAAALPAQWTPLHPLQAARQCVKVALPASWEPGTFALRVREGGEVSNVSLANAPDPWWLQGDEGQSATPGGWVRVFGKCLSLDPQATRLLLRDGAGTDTPLNLTQATTWALAGALPDALQPGEYEVFIHNGCGGDLTWRSAGKLTVIAPVAWKTDVFTVATEGEGADTDKAIHDALKQAQDNGGGIVYLPRGTYDVKGQLVIPPHTVLRGEGMGLVSLHWPDYETPPDSLIVANDCAIEDLSLYCRNHLRVITNEPTSDRLRLRRVRIRADAFFMALGPGETFRGRTAPSKISEGYVLRLTGRNFQVTDCDLWGSGAVLSLDPHCFTGQRGPWYGVISGNRIAYGSTGHLFENADCLIFERNDVMGRGTCAGGNGISTYWNNFSRHIYYAGNHVHDLYGIDREMVTLDGDGVAYFGTASADGTRLTLDADPVFRDYAPTPHTDYRGGVVYILDGTGAGQYRIVTANAGRDWTVDRPWEAPPDETSTLSIVPFRGRNLFIGNLFEDGGPVQLYGSAADVIVAENRGARMDAMFAWGLTQHGWGWHPAWRCQFLDNQFVEGSGYGARIQGPAFMGVVTSAPTEQYSGPLARGNILRRNVLQSGSVISLGGTCQDTLVEGCT